MVEKLRHNISTPENTYQGLSTDPKPTSWVSNKDTYYELDTKKVWTYSELNKNPATNNGWWEA
jgi:hypothetical protein